MLNGYLSCGPLHHIPKGEEGRRNTERWGSLNCESHSKNNQFLQTYHRKIYCSSQNWHLKKKKKKQMYILPSTYVNHVGEKSAAVHISTKCSLFISGNIYSKSQSAHNIRPPTQTLTSSIHITYFHTVGANISTLVSFSLVFLFFFL